jgi:hypothetical protein
MGSHLPWHSDHPENSPPFRAFAPAATPSPPPVEPGAVEATSEPGLPLPVRIASVPFGVPVAVDGVPKGRTPVIGLALQPGPHTFRFGEGDEAVEFQVRVAMGAENLWTWRASDGSLK